MILILSMMLRMLASVMFHPCLMRTSMSLFQFVIDLLAGFFEKDVVVGGKKDYLFEYDYPIDDKTFVSVKTNVRDSVGFIVPDDFLSEDYECNYRVGNMIPGSSQ